jgi:hypothetical protein
MADQFLDGPLSFLDPVAGEVYLFRVDRLELGDVILGARTGFGGGVRRCIRLHVPLEDKPEPPPYWDVTSKQLQAALEPLLPWIIERRRRVRIQAIGTAPRIAYSVDVLP